MDFDLVGEITDVETSRDRLRNPRFGQTTPVVWQRYWRKMKGTAHIRLRNGRMRLAELQWYEAHGIGKKEFKRKRYLD